MKCSSISNTILFHRYRSISANNYFKKCQVSQQRLTEHLYESNSRKFQVKKTIINKKNWSRIWKLRRFSARNIFRPQQYSNWKQPTNQLFNRPNRDQLCGNWCGINEALIAKKYQKQDSAWVSRVGGKPWKPIRADYPYFRGKLKGKKSTKKREAKWKKKQ